MEWQFFHISTSYILSLLSCVYIFLKIHLKIKFGWINFLFTLTCWHPIFYFTTLMKKCKCKKNGVTNVWPSCALFKHIQFSTSSRIWIPNHDFAHKPISNIGCVFWSEKLMSLQHCLNHSLSCEHGVDGTPIGLFSMNSKIKSYIFLLKN